VKEPHDGGLPCDELIAPWPLAALALLALNDHVLKHAWPQPWITGKLSDFAGLFVFPLVLTSLWSVGRVCARKLPGAQEHDAPVRLTAGQLRVAVVGTGLLFTAIKLSPCLGDALAGTLESLFPFADFAFVPDPTDLMALAILPLSYRHGMSFCTPPKAPPGAPVGEG
jgi:hypothetical protein